jgi:hypothetical protein
MTVMGERRNAGGMNAVVSVRDAVLSLGAERNMWVGVERSNQMTSQRLLAGLAVASILLGASGALVSLPAALGRVAATATGVVLVVATLAVLAVGIGGTGGLDHTHTPYWE